MSRVRGRRLPPGARYVGRPTRWGNPFKVGMAAVGGGSLDRAQAVDLFRAYAGSRLRAEPDWLEPLRGRDLACWCPPGEPCHADILIALLGGDHVQDAGGAR